jgi:hypothetical protein
LLLFCSSALIIAGSSSNRFIIYSSIPFALSHCLLADQPQPDDGGDEQ